MSFIYIIKHNLKGRPIFINDLGPNGWQSMPPRNFSNEMEKLRMLHNSFTQEQILNSQGLKQALACEWFKEVEIKFNNDNNSSNSETVTNLKDEINDLKSLITQLVENQKQASQVTIGPPVTSQNANTIDMEVLAKIAKDLKEIKTKTVGIEIEGYEELSPAMAALQARRDSKIQIIKDDNLKIKQKEVNVNINDMLDNLDHLD